MAHISGALAKARDLFCFCAFTSLRFSDMYNLRKKDVTENYIYVTTQKTNDRLLSTHAGRRTFICLALSSGIPPQVVMKWTGHCDYKSMKPYIDIAGKTKSDAMNTFANSLSL